MDEQNRTSTHSDNPLQQIKKALAMMASFRGAKIDTMTLNMYGQRLAREVSQGAQVQDVIAAIEQIADLPREPGELAFPEVGSILALVPMVKVSRINRENAVKQTVLVRWKCPVCRIHRSGYIHPSDYEPRVCRGVPREGMGVCGEIMHIV